jgi:hypothetical protein
LAAVCLTALFALFLFTRPMAIAAAEEADAEVDDLPAEQVEAAASETPAATPAADAAPGATAAVPAVPTKKDEKSKENLGQRRQGDVGRNEELSFLQSKVTAQMSELEERMFRLSEALKGLEPENASRLLIGLKYAREELIGLQMKEVQLALSSLKYSDAVVEEKQLLAKLQRLEQLLLSPDLDFQLQLERLRLMRDLMRRLDGAIKEEEREKSATNQAAAIEKQLEELRKAFEKAAAWGKKHDRPMYLGEFGSYHVADIDSRAAWTRAVVRESERQRIAWCYWEFGAGFGVFDRDAGNWRESLKSALLEANR